MSKALAIGILLLLPNTTGCGFIIAQNAISRHYDMRDKEVEYRHQERMRELQLQEQRQRQQPGQIVREVPF